MELDSSNFSSLTEAIATAESTLVGVTDADRLIFRQWLGTLIMPDLGLSEEDIKVVTLYPTSSNVLKPDDLKAIIDIELYDVSGCYLEHKYRAGVLRVVPDKRIYRAATNNSDQLNAKIPVNISSNYHSLYFGTNGDQVAYVVLRYWAFPTDDNGDPLIKTTEMKAVVLGLRYWFAQKYSDNRSEIDQNWKAYALEADRVRAAKKMLTVNNTNMKNIVKSIWMRQIPSFDLTGF